MNSCLFRFNFFIYLSLIFLTQFLLGCAFSFKSPNKWKMSLGKNEDIGLVICGEDLYPRITDTIITKFYLQYDNINHKDLWLEPNHLDKWYNDNQHYFTKCEMILNSDNIKLKDTEALIRFSKITTKTDFPFGNQIKVDDKMFLTDKTECYHSQGSILIIKKDSSSEMPYNFHNNRSNFTENAKKLITSICKD